jgi:hypothetical protein
MKLITFYLQDTCVNQNHSLSKTWKFSNDRGGLEVRMGKYGRMIRYYVGLSKTGSLEKPKLVFRPRKKILKSQLT